MLRFLLPILLFVSPAISLADDAPAEVEAPVSYRSSPDRHIWIGVDGGPEAGWWGVNSGGGIGFRHGLSARAQFGRCGAVFEWNRSWLEYFHPDPSSDLNMIGLGVACKAYTFGGKRFWKGAHLLARALVQYGSNRYSILDRGNLPLAAGTSYGWGGLVGADLMLPIYVGFWGFFGTGFEAAYFHYQIPTNTDDIHDNTNPTTNFFLRIGLAYSFL